MNSIDIILDGKIFASRIWENVPRIGEVIILKQGTIWAQVTQVVWGDCSGNRNQWIQILCKTIEQPAGIVT